jgi:bifunctional DNase/RNase
MYTPFTPTAPGIPVIVLELEDGREFTLYNVPHEIVRAINKLQSGDVDTLGERETIFDVVVDMRDFLSGVGERLERVVVDEIDYATALYTAKAYFNLGGISMTRRMVPSHAIFLALLYGKPIYVSKRLVDEQEVLGEAAAVEEDFEDEFEE